ncbi:MAG TPA: type II secretion system protein, partial [Tenericutes bacterium]|nr:type II secretion system protein [Mycoplasmatota bacterium]
MKRQHGFTLIELLAVIVILAVIALISTPIVLNVIEKTRKEAYKSSSLNVFKAGELYEAKNNFSGIDKNGVNINDLELDNNKFTSGKIIKNENNKLEIVNVTDGIYCSKGTKENLIVVKGSCDLLDETAPTNIKIVTNSVSTNKIVIVVYAEDDESGIKQYHYSLDGIDYKTTKSSSIELT